MGGEATEVAYATTVFAWLDCGSGVRGAAAAGHGTAAEAKALVEKAAALIASEGNDKAFAVIDDPKGPFVQGDLYVFVGRFDGTTVAHGANKALIGKNLLKVKDADGKLFVQDMVEMAKSKGEGWVDYKWPDPTTRKIASKSTFVKRVASMYVGCGVYKN